MPTGTNVTFRMYDETLDAVDRHARANGQTRTEYLLSWLPEAYRERDDLAQNGKTENGHAAASVPASPTPLSTRG